MSYEMMGRTPDFLNVSIMAERNEVLSVVEVAKW